MEQNEMMLLAIIQKYGLDFHIGPINDRWSLGIMWDHPPFKQVMAHDNRALIVSVTGSSPDEAIAEGLEKLKEWLESHKEVINGNLRQM